MRIRIEDAGVTLRDADRARRFVVARFEVASGDGLCLHGPSGAGKSTLLHLLAGLLVADRGQVQIGDVELTALGNAARDAFRARHIAYVFQTFNLLEPLTALENVALPLTLRGTPRAAARDTARQWLERADLATRVDAPCHSLSVGERQRVALARAFAGEPDLLLADEPTASLDAARRDALVRLMTTQAAELGVTLVLVTHDDRVAQAFAERRPVEDVVRWSEVNG